MTLSCVYIIKFVNINNGHLPVCYHALLLCMTIQQHVSKACT